MTITEQAEQKLKDIREANKLQMATAILGGIKQSETLITARRKILTLLDEDKLEEAAELDIRANHNGNGRAF